ncbi:putative disease resistance protein RGA3 [Rhodamnia argentea]|uniref:Disease resistance protein RGA3 n=1 Tax=Rhodamnia argentea TaxID=178133 RepID=A0A8B8MYJ7_9MYRT|nr:putative disease resistance protein RGA3 [Rhodamnia argentea]XP_048142041.1 putative disease resistance protein RGA3 [Rhodamnia argentea]
MARLNLLQNLVTPLTTMAEVASSILGPLVEKLTSSVFEEIQLVWGVKDDREKLKSMLEIIQKVLADAEQKQTKEEAVRHWLSKLKNFCYDAEDVLDEFEVKALQRWARSTGHLTFKRKVRYLFSWLSNFIFQFKMAHKMKELRERLDGINKEKTELSLSTNVSEKALVQRKETHSFVPVLNVIGRNEDKRKLIDLLMRSGEGGAGKIGVVPVVGIGGIGKTTLAKLVYMDGRVNEHFELKVWLSMPIEFEVKRIIRDIIQSIDHEASRDSWSLEMLQNHLRSLVENKRCLFVLDDVWEVRREDWLGLRDLLEGVSEGSKVIVTSRNKSIASIMGAVPPYNLSSLSLEDSLTLFTKCAFDQGQEKNHPDLMDIAREIVSKCGGNPMAVKTLGSLLHSKDNRSNWESVRDSEIWQLETDILPSLRISYDLMPSYLKQCFAYCSIFPKNYEFNSLELIQLWISNGLIQSSGGNQELEEIGQQYWEELWSRSFFDDVMEDYLFLTFKMHDLIHELAISVSQPESFNVNIRTHDQDVSSTTRHISFSDPSLLQEDELPSYLSKLSGVRTIMFPIKKEGPAGESFLEMCISRFKHLRVLYLHDSSFDQLPSSIGTLKHLRFLHLCSNRSIKKLPNSVCELYNLQSLGLAGCEELEELPANIKSMINLRFLDITTKQQRLPEGGIGCLTSLRCLFIGDCNNLEALFDDMQLLTSLRKLFIGGCPKLACLPQGIKNLKALENLWICNCENLKLPEGESDEPRSMSKLRTLMFMGLPKIVSFPRWLEGSARTLQRIDVAHCPNLSKLPEWLQNCSSLRKLKINDCPRLSSLPDGIRLIATLRELWIDDCPELSSRIAARSGEDWSKIAHIPEIYIDGRKMK